MQDIITWTNKSFKMFLKPPKHRETIFIGVVPKGWRKGGTKKGLWIMDMNIGKWVSQHSLSSLKSVRENKRHKFYISPYKTCVNIR